MNCTGFCGYACPVCAHTRAGAQSNAMKTPRPALVERFIDVPSFVIPQKCVPFPRQSDSAADRRPLRMIAQVALRLVAARVSGNHDTDRVGIPEHGYAPLRIVARAILG